MALAGELAKYAKYVGNELVKSSGKGVAKAGVKAGAKSALSSLVPSVATQVGTDLATKAGSNMATQGVLNSLVPIRSNWAGEGDIEGMLNGKFLGTNQNYFDSTFSRGALDRATYGPEQAVDRNKVAGLVRAIKNNEDIAPIAGFKNDDGLIDIFDGHHRLAAYQKAGKMPRVKLFDRATKDDAYAFADDWAKNAVKQVEQYLPAKPTTQYGLDENGIGKIDLRHLNEPKVSQSIDDSMIPIYHGTPNKFEDFDDSLPSVWFSDSNKNLKDTGLTMKGGNDINVMERMLPRDLKIADEDLADKLTKQQLQDRGYAGIAYTERGPNGDETYYEIFKPNDTLKKLKVQQSLELSPEQREFFKNSAVRDKDGNLMPVFHTTNTDKKIDRFNADNGMVWVTPNKMYSTGFAGNGYNPDRTYELYANIKKPVYVGHIDPAINDSTIERLSAYTGVDEESLLAIAEKYDARNIWEITNSKDFKELMQAKGYDGIEAREGGNQISYAAFSPEQVKRIGNLKPTSNPDIRMSYGYGGGYGSYDENVKRVGSSAVAPVREETLPEGWKELEKYLDTSKDRLSLAIGKPRSKITKQDLINFLEDYGYDTEGTKDDLWKNALMCIDDMAVDDLYNAGGSAGEFLQERLPFRHNDKLTDATNYYIGAKGRTGRLDAEYSDRLGIGRSNTPMSDRLVNPYSGAGGDYSQGAFGTNADWATGESGVSTSAHERMHAWQDINKFDWDEEVGDAIDELRGELKKFYHDEDAIKKYWGNSKTDYYMEDIEQEARMLQSYLDNEGFTNTYRKNSERGTEWGDEIKPAFDRFFKKLRALSKKGVALPAVAGLVGIGAMAGKKDDDKKLDNVE